MLKSDNANGLFSFANPCQPDYASEGESVICYITRTQGSDSDVTVHWQASSNDNDDKDFINYEGKVDFLAGEREKVRYKGVIVMSLVKHLFAFFLCVFLSR